MSGSPGTPAVRLDLTDPSTFRPAREGAEKVFIVRPPAISRIRSNFGPLIKTAEQVGVRHVVFFSVAGADSNRLVPHHRIEKLLTESTMAWTMLRPGFFAQNIMTAYAADIIGDDRIYVPAADGRASFIDANDIGVAPSCPGLPPT